jgi:hypothetical protein
LGTAVPSLASGLGDSACGLGPFLPLPSPSGNLRVIQVVDGGVLANPGSGVMFSGLIFANQLGVQMQADIQEKDKGIGFRRGYTSWQVERLIFLKVTLSDEAMTAISRGKTVFILALAMECGTYRYMDTNGVPRVLKAYDVGIPCDPATLDNDGHPNVLNGVIAADIFL